MADQLDRMETKLGQVLDRTARIDERLNNHLDDHEREREAAATTKTDRKWLLNTGLSGAGAVGIFEALRRWLGGVP